MDRPTIIDVRRRSEQGITQPFFCRADDGYWYWVKGHDAGRHSLCAEWLAGLIAIEDAQVTQCCGFAESASQILAAKSRGLVSDWTG